MLLGEKPCAFEKIHPGFGSLFEIQMNRYNPADAANAPPAMKIARPAPNCPRKSRRYGKNASLSSR